jgi:hypothetical protein
VVATTEKCPWCGSAITHSKFLQIQAAIREDERKKLADAEKTLRAQLEKEVAVHAQKLMKERQALDAERAKMAKQFDLSLKKEVANVRQILQKDRETALLRKDAEFAREREALQKKISDMSRRVKKGQDVGEGAELNLYDELREAFPEDQITHVRGKGTAANLLHDVRYKGKSAGKLLIDAKPRGAWQQAFVTKLRQEQSDTGADQAVLATTIFPSGKRELFVDSGVIVVAPARVRAIVEVLRKALITMHAAKLGEAERADKLGRLFRFITSATFKRKLAEAGDLAGEALQIDVDEKRAHDNVWKKRGTVLTRIKNVLREIDTDVTAILESRDEPPPLNVVRPAAFQVKE